MVVLLFVSALLLHGDKSIYGIDKFLLGLVDDVDLFKPFLWGTYSYNYMVFWNNKIKTIDQCII